MRHGCDFMRRLGTKRDQRSRIGADVKLFRPAKVCEDERSAAVTVWLRRVCFATEKYNCRNEPAFGVESKQTGVAVLMSDEEVALLVTKKLRLFALSQLQTKMLAGAIHAIEQARRDQLGSLIRGRES